MSDELLPCPFCGERPVLLRDESTAAHACSALDIELRVPRRAWNHRFPCSVPVYSDGEPIMPGNIVRHPDMHDSRMVTEVVLGLHGAFVRRMCGFETMRHDLFRRADADTPASLADEIDNG